MDQVSSIENFNIAKYTLRNWQPLKPNSVNLKKQMLDFLEIIESERKRLIEQREAGMAEQQQFEMALCHTHDAISITSTDGIVRLVNPAFEKLTGYKGHEIIGESLDKFWTYSDPSKMDEMLITIRAGKNWQGELSIITQNGNLLDLETAVVPIIQPTGEISHYVYTLHDITHRLGLEKRLKQQKQFLEKVINLNPSLIIILNELGEWLLDNLAAKTLLSDLGEGARENLSEKIQELVKNAKANEPQKLELTLSKGSKRTFLMVGEEIPAKYLMPESDLKTLYLVTLSDITENERNNREILVRQKALTAARIERSMIQGEFINGFIYHLQKPLNVSKAGITRLKKAMEKGQYEQIGHTIELMKQELEFLEAELTKYRTIPQTHFYNEETTTADDLTNAIKVLYQDLYKSGNIEINLLSAGIITYPLPYEHMQMLLKILVDNANEAVSEIESDIKIKISFGEGSSESRLVVEDNGPGIESTSRYKIFEPFYTTKTDHAGLSLTILHQMINNIQGSVEIEQSNLGGAKATLYFPMESA